MTADDIDWNDPDWNAYYLRRMQEYIPGITLEQLRASRERYEARQRGEPSILDKPLITGNRTREESLQYILTVMQMKYPDVTMEELERRLARNKQQRIAEKEAAAAKRKAKREAKNAR